MSSNENNLKARDLNQQAVILMEAGNAELAQQKLDQAIALDPMVVDSYKNYGDYYIAKEQYQEAKNAYKKALLIEKRGELYFLLGNACFLLDQFGEGVENYNLAISNGYDNDEMMFFMGMAYENTGDSQMAIRYFKKACDKNPARSDYQVKKIYAMIDQQMHEAAEQEVDHLIANSPELFDGYNLKTILLIQRGAIKEAIAFTKMAAEKFPEDVDLRFNYVKTVALGGNLNESLDLIEDTIRFKYYKQSEYKYLLLKAQICAEQGELDKATQVCEQCVALEQEGDFFNEVRFMLLNLYIVQKKFGEALQYAEDFIEYKREDTYYYSALYYRAFCKKQLGDVEQAVALYKDAVSFYRLETLQNPAAIDIYIYRIMALKDLEQYEDALELSDFVLGVNSEVAEVYVLRSDIFNALGKKTLAEQALTKAYQLKPELKPTESASLPKAISEQEE